MDKELDELRNDIQQTLQTINDSLLELNEYLDRLRTQTIADLRALSTREPFFGPPIEPSLDPRQPYLAGRQPRRDGDSFGSVPESPTSGGVYGTEAAYIRQRRRAQGQKS